MSSAALLLATAAILSSCEDRGAFPLDDAGQDASLDVPVSSLDALRDSDHRLIPADADIEGIPDQLDASQAADAIVDGPAAPACTTAVGQGDCPDGLACDLRFPTSGSTQGAHRFCRTPGVATQGQDCRLQADCERGSTCINRHCRRYCTADDHCAGEGSICARAIGYVQDLWHPEMTCSLPCVPWTAPATGCPGHLPACRVQSRRNQDDTLTAYTHCDQAGSVAVGGDCSLDHDLCQAGLFCADSKVCRKLCNSVTGAGCGPKELCTAFRTPLVVQGARVGVCQPVAP